MVRLLYNSKGETLYQAGGLGLPDVYQEPYSTLDLVWKQRLGFLSRNLSMTVNLTNVTDERYELNGGFEQRYQRGRGFGLGFSYTVF
mgnify:CR=1 FL=1